MNVRAVFTFPELTRVIITERTELGSVIMLLAHWPILAVRRRL